LTRNPRYDDRSYTVAGVATGFTPSLSRRTRRSLRAASRAVWTFWSLELSSKKITTSQLGHCLEYPGCSLRALSRNVDRHRLQWIWTESDIMLPGPGARYFAPVKFWSSFVEL
jgi:hypothetical protein